MLAFSDRMHVRSAAAVQEQLLMAKDMTHCEDCAESDRLTNSQLFTFPNGSGMKGWPSSCRHCPSTTNLYWWYLQASRFDGVSQTMITPSRLRCDLENLNLHSVAASRPHSQAVVVALGECATSMLHRLVWENLQTVRTQGASARPLSRDPVSLVLATLAQSPPIL